MHAHTLLRVIVRSNLFKRILIIILKPSALRWYVVFLHNGNGNLVVFDQSPTHTFKIFDHDFPRVANRFLDLLWFPHMLVISWLISVD